MNSDRRSQIDEVEVRELLMSVYHRAPTEEEYERFMDKFVHQKERTARDAKDALTLEDMFAGLKELQQELGQNHAEACI